MVFEQVIGRCLAALLGSALAAQDRPQVLALSPPHGSVDVDPGTTELVVSFDVAMGAGRSVVGGGPTFPAIVSAAWRDPKTFVMEVRLEPDHDYVMALNNQRFTNFRSAEGGVLAPVSWHFTTLPAELPDPVEQGRRNRDALDALASILAERYSYYDLRVKDWEALMAKAQREVLAAKTDTHWASLAARALEPTDDIHLYFRHGDRTFATGRRAIDPLYRQQLLSRSLTAAVTAHPEAGILTGRDAHGIGYLMVPTWTDRVDLDAVDTVLADLRDCKAIVVDARPNAGGNELMARRVAAWFVQGTKVYAKNRVRTGAGADGFGPVLTREIEGHRDADRRFDVPIAVLTSRYVMSSNEAFVLMLRQAADCTVVGQPTYGSSGNPRPHDLGNGVTVLVPSWQALRPDGTCFEGEGLAPDVLVELPEDWAETRDPILEKALGVLRAKIGVGK